MNARPANRANFQMPKPSRNERLAPKKRVIMQQMINGIRVPTMAWGIAAKTPIW